MKPPTGSLGVLLIDTNVMTRSWVGSYTFSNVRLYIMQHARGHMLVVAR